MAAGAERPCTRVVAGGSWGRQCLSAAHAWPTERRVRPAHPLEPMLRLASAASALAASHFGDAPDALGPAGAPPISPSLPPARVSVQRRAFLGPCKLSHVMQICLIAIVEHGLVSHGFESPPTFINIILLAWSPLGAAVQACPFLLTMQ